MTPRLPPQRSARLLLLLGLIGLAGATWGPWVAAGSPGLTLLGLDLAEYVKFLPEVRSGALSVARAQFYLPLFTLSVGLSFLALRSGAWLPRVLRLILTLLAIPCALALLPPAWSPATFGQAEFQAQLRLLAVALTVALLSLLAPWLPRRRRAWQALAGLLALLALTATILPLWQWSRVRPAIEIVYHRALNLGWGGWSLLVGGVALAAGAALLAWAEARADA